MKKKLFIGGEWVEAKRYADLRSPYSGEPIALVPLADQEETESAIAAADRARKAMASLPLHARSKLLSKLADLLEERAEEAARIISLEVAKPLKAARIEVARTIETYRFSAEEAKRIHGETLPMDASVFGEGRIAYTAREPIGVIGAITPFNFPMNLVAHKVGPAIAAGNTIVLKPASQAPLSSFFLAELLAEAGLPPGAFNVVTGSGSVVGEIIATDSRVSMITFTGSPSVGIGIRGKAGLKRVTLELGSNAALIVDRGFPVDAIVDRCVGGAFSFQGQVCISLQRIFAHREVYDEFVEKLREKTEALRIGDPLDEGTDVSALISAGDVTRVLSWIEEAKRNGAEIACGGRAEGNVMLPTILLNVESHMRISCQEAFAPVVTVDAVDSIEEAIERVNDSRFGLQAGIYTENVFAAHRAADRLRVGGVMINDIPSFRVDHMPYGGVKESGFGREGVKYAIEEMTEMKLLVWNKNIPSLADADEGEETRA